MPTRVLSQYVPNKIVTTCFETGEIWAPYKLGRATAASQNCRPVFTFWQMVLLGANMAQMEATLNF